MSKIVDEIKKGIKQFKNPQLKAILLAHLSEDADDQTQLFTKKHSFDRPTPNFNRATYVLSNGLSYQLILNMVFVFAPTEVCQEITNALLQCHNEEIAELVSGVHHHHSDSKANEWVMETIMNHAPPHCRSLISQKVKSFNEKQITRVLFSELCSHDFATLRRLLNFNDEKSSIDLIDTLNRLDKNTVYEIFKTTPFPPTYEALIEFYSENPPNKLASAVAALLYKYEGSYLSSLVFGGGYFTSSSSNLLHGIFEFQSEGVISECFSFLLKNFPPAEIQKLLTQRRTNGSNHTPLELAFQRKDNKEAALRIAQKLYKEPSLKPLLSQVSVSQFYSLMHLAAKSGNTDVVAFFIQRPDTPIDHCVYSTTKGMLQVAQDANQTEVINLLAGLPIYQFIYKNLSASDTKTDLLWVQNLIKRYPLLVHAHWEEKKTLLSHASSKGMAELVPVLLSAGALPETDEQGHTAIDEAIKNNHIQVLDAFIKGARNNPIILENLIKTFLKLATPSHSYEELQRTLQLTSKMTFVEVIENHSFQKHDCYIYLLLGVAKLLSDTSEEIIWQAIRNFLQKSLNQLQKEEDLYLHRNARQLQVIVLLFALNPTHFFALVYSLELNESAKKVLFLILSRGLVQPAIFTKLTLSEHQLFYRLLADLQGSDLNALEPIATVHFQKSQLTLLPPEILKDLAANLTGSTLLSLCERRLNPSLLILTIEKFLAIEPVNQTQISRLFEQLGKEFQLFNKDNLDDAELQQALNVACHPQVKNYVRTCLPKGDSPLKQRIMRLFTNYKTTSPLIPDSLLYDLYMQFAFDYKITSIPTNQPALSALLAKSNPNDVLRFIINLQKTFQSQLLVAGMLAPISPLSSKDDNAKFSTWIYDLEHKKQRLCLASLISHYDQFHACTKQLFSEVKGEELPSLKNALDQLLTGFDSVASHLFHFHIGESPLLFEEKLKPLLKTLERHFSKVNLTLKQLKENPSLKTKYAAFITEFEQSMGADEVHILCQQTIFNCQKIEEDTNKYAETSLSNDNDITLGQLFDSEMPQEELIATASLQSLQTTQTLEQFNQSILSGVLAHPKREQLLNGLFNWVFSCGSVNEPDLLLKNMPQLLRTISKEDWKPVEHQMNERLILRDSINPIVLDLQVLNLSAFSLPDLLAVFYETDEERLAQLIEFCMHAQLIDLKAIANYVLIAKQQSIPLDILKIQNTLSLPEGLSTWLQQRLAAIEFYSSKVMSFKVLKEGLFINEGSVCTHLENLDQIVDGHYSVPSPKAINIMISSYSSILNQPNSAESQALIISLSNLFKNMSVQLTNETLSQLPLETIEQLITHCLTGINNDNQSYNVACRTLLTNLCQLQSSSNTQILSNIKLYVGQQDLTILGSKQLISIASEVLETKEDDLEALTINGVWIQRLLTSPRFIAASTPATIQALIDRYRFISLTLKQDEFEHLNHWIKTKLAFYEHHKESLSRVEKSLLTDPKRLEHLLKKRERLLSFRADDSIRALLNQLEDNCIELKSTEAELADSALDVLYAHYNNSLTGLRSDFLFKVADFVVSRVSRSKGDIEVAQDTLLKWLTSYLPHKNFEQTELIRKSHVSIYNAEGVQIGFVNEANQAMTFIDDTPSSLLELKGICPGIPLYDDARCLMGTLTYTGEVKRENLFQKNTSALLVAKVPTEQLSKSPAALELLMTDIFTENTLESLYTNTEVEKHPWLEEQIQTHSIDAKKLIHADNLQIIVQKQSAKTLFSMLENMKHKENAEQLFEIMLNDDNKRPELFSTEYRQSIFAFFKHGNLQKIFANYLQNHYNNPWFNQGLQLFSQFAQNENQPELLSSSLQLLNERTFTQKQITESTYDAVLTTLLNSEENTQILWKAFLNGTEGASIKEIDTHLADDLTGFFYKHHCMPLIKAVNEQKSWSQSSQYRLLLLIFAKQRQQIFQQNELRYSEKLAWSSAELKQVSTFVKRHFLQVDTPDKQHAIGKELIGELIFRCANFGQTQLFYDDKGRFDAATAGNVMERSYLHAIAAREYLPPQIRKTISDVISKFKGWFDNEHQKTEELTELLKNNQALIDWKQLSNESWSMSNSMTTLPIISAYLLNYSGETGPMVQLVKDYFSSKIIQKNPGALHAVSQVMAKFPQRNVSSCLFSTLEEIFNEKPLLLDTTILQHMAQFYSYKHLKTTVQSPQQEINLIKHFGLQKKYALVQRCCDLLLVSHQEKSLGELLQKTNLEARVESQLNSYVGSWFFSIIRFVKRIWHYGFGGSNKSSNLVSYCDTPSDYTSPVDAVDKIHTPILPGHTVASQIETTKKLKSIRERHHRFLEKYPLKTTHDNFKLSKTSTAGIFGKKNNIPESMPAIIVNLGQTP
ncbi:ankyrin repeat domain-containing protein [Legionella hackeliae]|uniref:Dot/Icm T4SS effector n=1 Tax=Legionella hackeliae TaxID=449 RepID=A0A0A8UTN6_LEGHA|nr:ankyrin repeat domain-containing protein [Legionella hackeliae]CEK10896.1 protein of unknown function [ankyrin repeat][coiled coil] [Legionella hackeliae]